MNSVFKLQHVAVGTRTSGSAPEGCEENFLESLKHGAYPEYAQWAANAAVGDQFHLGTGLYMERMQ